MDIPQHDGLDDLLRRTAPPLPPELMPRTHRRLAVARRSRRLALALALQTAALLGLAVLAVQLGRALDAGGSRDLIGFALRNHWLLTDDPAWFGAALLGALPWPHLCLLATDLLVLTFAARYLLHATDPPARKGKR
jgi:hypothetical protein